MHKVAVITAGGAGLRMGSNTPKQFLLLKGRSILWHTISAFIQAYADIQLILVLPKDFMQEGIELAMNMGIVQQTTIVKGGLTRFESVKNGLSKVVDPAIIFVHDGVRCLVTSELIQRCFQQAVTHGTAIPAVAATDSIRLVDGYGNHLIDRNSVRLIQTPQTFQSNIILSAFNQPYQDTFTDEASVVEANGGKVFLVEGDYQNIKITRPIDLILADHILGEREG